MAISSSVNPYNSYTNRSISRSAASAFGVALKHGLDVRRPLGRELFVQVHACGSALDQRHHPVVPRDVGGGGEVDGADGGDLAQKLIHREPGFSDNGVQRAPGDRTWMIGHCRAPMRCRVVPDLVTALGLTIEYEASLT
jgi:hypothetical protein